MWEKRNFIVTIDLTDYQFAFDNLVSSSYFESFYLDRAASLIIPMSAFAVEVLRVCFV
jgi:hypothetical protein